MKTRRIDKTKKQYVIEFNNIIGHIYFEIKNERIRWWRLEFRHGLLISNKHYASKQCAKQAFQYYCKKNKIEIKSDWKEI